MRSAAAATVLLCLAAATARAQELRWTIYGLENDGIGSALAGGYDLDGDGVPDVVAGGNLSGGPGVVTVRSGVDGTFLYELLGEKRFDGFGLSIATFPDLDGDGLGDFLVGARNNDWRETDAGSAYLFSGADGALIRAFRGDLVQGHFGERVANVGDLDGDGVHDLAISAPDDWTIAGNSGAVFLYSGADHHLIRTIYGSTRPGRLGKSLAAAGDVNGDGTPDLIAGAPDDSEKGDRAGAATVFSGADGSVLYRKTGFQVVSNFGGAVAGAGDVNGDGHADFAISAPIEDAPIDDCGHLYVYSGADGSLLRDRVGSAPQQRFCALLSNVGDLNGDGFDELVGGDLSDVLAPDAGAARLFSGRTGRLLYRLDGLAASDNFGMSAGLGDIDGDGLGDLAIGAPSADGGGNASGAVSAYLSHELFLQVDPDSVAPDKNVTVFVRGGEAASLYAILVGDSDEIVWLTLSAGTLDANGETSLVDLSPPGLAGLDFVFRAFANGPVDDHRPPLASNPEFLRFR